MLSPSYTKISTINVKGHLVKGFQKKILGSLALSILF